MDQAEFSRLSFCGLQCGICACGGAEVDACLFERLNVDGCAIGAYFAPKAAYYVRFRQWVAADNPYYGLYVNGENRQNRRMEISGIQFIRSGNTVSGLVFTSARARLILRGEGNRVWGAPEEGISAETVPAV